MLDYLLTPEANAHGSMLKETPFIDNLYRLTTAQEVDMKEKGIEMNESKKLQQ